MDYLKFIIIFALFLLILTKGEDEVGDDELKKFLSDEMGNTFEFKKVDDMILSPKQYNVLYTDPGRRNGYGIASRLWNDALVPYIIDGNYSNAEMALIRTTLKIFETKTCLKFKELPKDHTEKDYVYVEDGQGCASMVGHWSGKQIIQLNKQGCLDVGRILHEFLHVLGFFHMHTTIGRDDHVTIMWENIIPSTVQNFVSYVSDVSMFGTDYDFDSVTHYSPKAFSKDGKSTIVSKMPDTEHLMGQRDHLSEGDIIRVNRMYNCA